MLFCAKGVRKVQPFSTQMQPFISKDKETRKFYKSKGFIKLINLVPLIVLFEVQNYDRIST